MNIKDLLKPTKQVTEQRYGNATEKTVPNPPGIATLSIIAVLAITFGLGGLYVNDPGEGTVEFNRWTGEYETTDEGMHWRFLMSTTKQTYDVRETLATSSEQAAAQDGLPIDIEVSVLYSLDEEDLQWIHQNLGKDYFAKVIQPAIKESIKSCSTGKEYVDLLRERAQVGQCTEDIIGPRLAAKGMSVHEVDLRDITPPESVRNAIEKVQQAEQEAEAEENRLRAKQAIAEQIRVEADAKAYAAEVIGKSSNNQAYLYLQWLEVWNGVLPIYYGAGEDIILPAPQ